MHREEENFISKGDTNVCINKGSTKGHLQAPKLLLSINIPSHLEAKKCLVSEMELNYNLWIIRIHILFIAICDVLITQNNLNLLARAMGMHKKIFGNASSPSFV